MIAEMLQKEKMRFLILWYSSCLGINGTNDKIGIVIHAEKKIPRTTQKDDDFRRITVGLFKIRFLK